ncbi:MAG: hypothetical protein AAF682_30735 [Planctomycetota bacterium]
MNRWIARVGLVLAVLAGGMSAQVDEVSASTPILSVESIELKSYTPRHVNARELYQLASETVAREFYLKERGGLNGAPVLNLNTLGDRLIVYDEPKVVARILASLQTMDQQSAVSPVAPRVQYSVREYAPRFISLDAAVQALEPLTRRDETISPGGERNGTRNVTAVRERNLLVLRDTEENLATMTDLLVRIDQPEPQALLTCYLVRGKAGGDSSGLPKDLVDNMAKLVPQFALENAGFSMLQTSIAIGRTLSLRIDGKGTDKFELSFVPVAYDAATASLTVQRCSLQREYLQEQGGGLIQGAKRQVFSTSTVFRGGEYTVLGAAGSDPVFLVVRLAPLN